MERIMQEKISADHLLYVSMKYTKTTDVMLNLLARWRSLIDMSIDKLLERAKKTRKLKTIPTIPKLKIDTIRDVYKKDKTVIDTIDLYEFFKTADNAEKIREHEFRKNVVLRIKNKGEWINIDMDKLKEYAELLERFITNIKQIA